MSKKRQQYHSFMAVAALLTAAGIGHLARLIFGWTLFINGVVVPMWVSIVLVIVVIIAIQRLWYIIK